jgi:hypothetical protein
MISLVVSLSTYAADDTNLDVGSDLDSAAD